MALCTLLIGFPVAAANSGTVRVSGTIQSTIKAGPSGPLVYVGRVQSNPNKKEWYYIYAVNGLSANEGKITFQSNRPWGVKLKATQTGGDKKK